MIRTTSDILILGIGNLLLGDEGVAIHAVREFEKRNLPQGVLVLDGGVGSFYLLDAMQSAGQILIVDATLDSLPVGTIRVLHPEYSSDYPRTLTAHDVGLKDLLDAFYFSGRTLPPVTLIAITIAQIPPDSDLSLELTQPLRNSMPLILNQMEQEMNKMLTFRNQMLS